MAAKQARVHLAAAYRACANLGLHEAVFNHLTLAVPDRPNHFLVNAFGVAWHEVTAGNLLEVEANEGAVVEGKGEPDWGATCCLSTAFGVHSQLHVLGGKRRNAILHTHMPWVTSLLCRQAPDNRVMMCSQAALRLYDDIAYGPDYDGLVTGKEEGKLLHEALGERNVLLLPNHGAVVCGETVADAFYRLYYLERAAEVQMKASSAPNVKLRIIPDEVGRRFRQMEWVSPGGTGKNLNGETQPRKGPDRFFQSVLRGLASSTKDKDFADFQ